MIARLILRYWYELQLCYTTALAKSQIPNFSSTEMSENTCYTFLPQWCAQRQPTYWPTAWKKSETEYPGWYTNQHGCRIHKRIQYTFIMLSSQKFKKIVPLPAGFEPLSDGKISSMSALTSRATMSYTDWNFILYYLPMFQFQEKRLKWILLHHHFYRRSDDSM